MTFKEFKARVDRVIEKICGYSSDDCVDANWRLLFDESHGHCSARTIAETLAQVDGLFRSAFLDFINEGGII